jgi:hypothetical protein
MNKIIVLILIIFIVVYFMFNFDVYVIKKNSTLCKPLYINYNSNHHNDIVNDNNSIIKIHGHNLDINQEMYNRINKQLQS